MLRQIVLSALLTSVLCAQPFAYVANVTGFTVAVVNTSTNSVVSSIPVPGASGLALTPDGALLYVCAQTTNSVYVINTANNSVVATIGVGLSPVQLAVSPNGAQVYVVDQSSNQVTVIDTGSNSVVGRIAVGLRPTAVAISPDSRRAFVTNLWSGTVSVIDTGSKTVVSSFPVGSGPSAIDITPNGRYAYVANEYSNSVTVRDLTSGTTVATIPGFAFPTSVAITPDGTKALVTNANASSVSAIDIACNRITTTFGVGNYPSSIAIDNEGKRAYVTNQYNFSLSVLDVAAHTVIQTLQNVGIYPFAVAVAPQAPGVGPVCTMSTSMASTAYGSGGGTGSVTITAPNGCTWSAVSDSSWLLTTSSGIGTGVMTFSVDLNSAAAGRTGHLSVGGQTLIVTEDGMGFNPIRINCGGPKFVDTAGRIWTADDQGNHSETVSAIVNTTFQSLYRKDRWSTGTLQYQFNIPNGPFNVKLHFAEFYLTARGQRIFNIVINGVTVYPGFDILAATGVNSAVDQTFPVIVDNGRLTIQLVPIFGSPKLNALEIL